MTEGTRIRDGPSQKNPVTKRSRFKIVKRKKLLKNQFMFMWQSKSVIVNETEQKDGLN